MHSLISNLACLVATYAVNALWQIPLLAGAGWVTSRLVGRMGPGAQHRVWVTTLLLSIGLPAAAAVRMLMGAASGGPAGSLAGFPLVVGGSAGSDAVGAAGVLLPGWAIETVFVSYGLVVAGGAARLLWLLRRTTLLVAESEPVTLDAERERLWENCQRAFSVKAARLLTSRQVPGVVTVGKRLLVPEGFVAACTETEFRSALGHECAHLRRGDALKHLLYEAAGLLTTFHPVSWMVKARVAETREMVCDAMVVERLVEARSYTQSLLHLAERMLRAGVVPIHAIGMFDANALEKRIMRIKAKTRQASAPVRWALLLCGTLLLGSAAGMGVWLGTGVEVRAADHTASDAGKIYRPGDDGVTNPKLIYAPDPEFPKGDKSKGGICVVGLVVDAQGMPQDVHVVRSLKADFDANALATARRYRFKPGMREGKPVAVRIHIEMNYRRY